MRHFVCSIIFPPRLVFFRVSVLSPRVGNFSVFVFKYQDLSANRWYTARLALAYFALSHTSDAAPSSFVSRFQRSGDCSLFFFASFRVPEMFGPVVLFSVYLLRV